MSGEGVCGGHSEGAGGESAPDTDMRYDHFSP